MKSVPVFGPTSGSTETTETLPLEVVTLMRASLSHSSVTRWQGYDRSYLKPNTAFPPPRLLLAKTEVPLSVSNRPELVVASTTPRKSCSPEGCKSKATSPVVLCMLTLLSTLPASRIPILPPEVFTSTFPLEGRYSFQTTLPIVVAIDSLDGFSLSNS